MLKTHSKKKLQNKNYKYITARTQASQNDNFKKITNKKSNYHSKKKLELNQIQRDLVRNLEKSRSLEKRGGRIGGPWRRRGGWGMGKAERVAVVGVSEKNKE